MRSSSHGPRTRRPSGSKAIGRRTAPGRGLACNSGWDQDAQAVDPFTDVREVQRRLKDAWLTFVQEADESTTGPASFIVVDPDGNPVLFDQHR